MWIIVIIVVIIVIGEAKLVLHSAGIIAQTSFLRDVYQEKLLLDVWKMHPAALRLVAQMKMRSEAVEQAEVSGVC